MKDRDSDDSQTGLTRRQLLGMVTLAGAGLAASMWAPEANAAAEPQAKYQDRKQSKKNMNIITTKDRTEIYFKDWGNGTPIVFSHGWPLSSDAFEDQMFFLASHGYRCIAHDRRGHGRSSQPWNGNDLDTYANDLATLVETLDLKNAIHVGHSTGGGEVAPSNSPHGPQTHAKARVH